MVERIKKEKLFFEMFWLVLTATGAILKLYYEYVDKQVDSDYKMILYTLIIFLLPILFGIRMTSNLFILRYKGRNFKNKLHEKSYRIAHNILYYGFWLVICSTLIFQTCIYQFEFNETGKKVLFCLMLFVYSIALFLGMTNKCLNYIEANFEGENI